MLAWLYTEKARYSGRPIRPSHPAYPLISDESIQEALQDLPKIRHQARIRILAEHQGKIDVNRCPSCKRIVRTPKAEQCFWCGHDWHANSPSQTLPQT